jgi:phosphatidylserine decarboxylase
LTLFCVYFFRNPRRTITEQPGSIVSPADGRVMDIETVYEDNYLLAESQRVRIFLSIFNVHINRFPLTGQVEWVKRVSGLYLPAYKTEAGMKNARNYVGFVSEIGKILVVQVTGIVARRLVCG